MEPIDNMPGVEDIDSDDAQSIANTPGVGDTDSIVHNLLMAVTTWREMHTTVSPQEWTPQECMFHRKMYTMASLQE